jgi:hypothetical protein
MKKLNCKKGFACRKSCISKLKECRVSVSDNSKQRLIELNQNIVKVNEAVGPLPADFLAFITDTNPAPEQKFNLLDTNTNKKADKPKEIKAAKVVEPKEPTNKEYKKSSFIRNKRNSVDPEKTVTEELISNTYHNNKANIVLKSAYSAGMSKFEALSAIAWVTNDHYEKINGSILNLTAGSDTNFGLSIGVGLESALKKLPRYSPDALQKRYVSDPKFNKNQDISGINQKAFGKKNKPDSAEVKAYEAAGRNADSDYFLKRNVTINSKIASDILGRMIGDGNLNNGVHSNDTFDAFTYRLDLSFFESDFEMLLKPKTDGSSEGRLVDQLKTQMDEGEVLYAPGNKFMLDKIELQNPNDVNPNDLQKANLHIEKMRNTKYENITAQNYKEDTKTLATLLDTVIKTDPKTNNKVRLYISEV